MKNENVITTKKMAIAVSVAALSVGMLMGCGKKAASEVKEEPKQEAVEEVKEESVEDVAEVEEEESSVNPPFLEDLEKYDSIISTLTTDQYYAFAAVGDGYDVLLVADGVYDNLDGNMAAIDATVYGLDNGKPCYAGNVWSDGTAYPIAVYEDMLMFGGNHSMTMANVIDSSVIIQKEAYEEFDEQGNATYFLNEGDIDNIKELEDNSVLTEMFDKYSQAIVLNFFQGEAEPSEELIGDEGAGDYPSNAFEERVGKTSFDSYDEIIGLLEGDEAYALVNMKGYDGQVLLVAESVYDDLLGHMATIESTPYTIKADGKASADSLLVSGGTATPLAMDKEGCVLTASHQNVDKQCYGENGTPNKSMMILTSVYADELDDNGVPKTVSGFKRTKNSLVDDDNVFLNGDEVELWTQLWKEYEKAEPINFTKVSK
ncbi:MAG: hypothetical protein Q4D29_05005 [Lachnospiraceae bacterium]|nr:hypothetical protein [Lachnospiraceae bacterium]